MLPLPNAPTLQSVAAVPPPPYFTPATGVIRASFSQLDHFAGKTPLSRKKALQSFQSGLRYERKVKQYLTGFFPDIILGPWLLFDCGSGRRYCQPDALLLGDRGVAILEVKLRHMPEAYWQLRHLYEPVVRVIYPKLPVCVVEICRSYDPATPFPEEVRVIKSLGDVWELDDKMGVLVWTP